MSRAALKAVTVEERHKRVLTISLQHLAIHNEMSSAQKPEIEMPPAPAMQPISFKQRVDDFSRQLIQQKLSENDNNMAKTAQVFGLDRGNFFGC